MSNFSNKLKWFIPQQVKMHRNKFKPIILTRDEPCGPIKIALVREFRIASSHLSLHLYLPIFSKCFKGGRQWRMPCAGGATHCPI